MLEKEKQILEKEIGILHNTKGCLLYEVDEDDGFTGLQEAKLCSAISFIDLAVYQLRELILMDSPPQNNIN